MAQVEEKPHYNMPLNDPKESKDKTNENIPIEYGENGRMRRIYTRI